MFYNLLVGAVARVFDLEHLLVGHVHLLGGHIGRHAGKRSLLSNGFLLKMIDDTPFISAMSNC